MTRRPEQFTLNPYHHLAQGLVFTGLGQHPGSTHYHDSSLYGNHGTLTNMDPATDWGWDDELNRYALDFDGSDDLVNLGRSTSLQPTGATTLAVWVKRDGEQDNLAGLLALPGDGTAIGQMLTLLNTEAGRFYRRSGGWDDCDTNSALPNGEWTHLCGVSDGSLMQSYVDGMLQSDTDATTNVDYGTVDVDAKLGDYAGINYDGLLADPVVYNRALSPSEIALLASRDPMLGGLIEPVSSKSLAFFGALSGIGGGGQGGGEFGDFGGP